MQLYLVRHAESVANAKGLLSSYKDDGGLTKRGRAQCRELAQKLDHANNFHMVYISPFDRTLETFSELDKLLPGKFSRIAIDERLVELNYGRWHNQRIANVENDLKEMMQQVYGGDYQVRFGDTGENQFEFLQRVYAFLQTSIGSSHKVILVITHSSVVAVMEKLLLRLLPVDQVRTSIKNAEAHLYTIENPGLLLRRIEQEWASVEQGRS